MRNFILAITSFIATVILLSQVALAQNEGQEEWDPKHTVAASGEESATNTQGGRSASPGATQAASPEAGEKCDTCLKDRAPVKLWENSAAQDKASGTSKKDGNRPYKGSK